MDNNNGKQVIFIDGIYSDDVNPNAPEYIMGQGSINLEKLITFATAHKHIAINGIIKYTIKKAKSGKRYVEVDQYGMENYKKYLESKKMPQFDINDIPFE